MIKAKIQEIDATKGNNGDKSITGAGDLVHALAHPIAVVIDHVFKTHIGDCGGCARRREKLNEIIPFRLANSTKKH